MSLTFLGRTMDLTDFEQLQNELHYVDHYIGPQQAHRRWQYALALHAIGRWVATGRQLGDTLYDLVLQPSTSKFHLMLDDWSERDTQVLDVNTYFCVAGTPLVNLITAHSVLEHVPHVEQFLYRCSSLLAPGGLLVLTMAYWNHCGADEAYGKEDRRRIFCQSKYRELRDTAASYHLNSFGGIDPSWHGAHHHDYSFASLVLEKKR